MAEEIFPIGFFLKRRHKILLSLVIPSLVTDVLRLRP